MNNKELEELSNRARQDGQRLFATATTLNKIGLAGVAILGSVGFIGGLALMSNGGAQVIGGLLTFAVTAFLCSLIYLGVVLSTSLSRVLVHSMFCMLSTSEALSQDARVRAEDNTE